MASKLRSCALVSLLLLLGSSAGDSRASYPEHKLVESTKLGEIPTGIPTMGSGYWVDPDCGPQSIKLYSEPEHKGDRLCISHSPHSKMERVYETFNLHTACKESVTLPRSSIELCLQSWAGQVRSFEAGSLFGYFASGAKTKGFAAAESQAHVQAPVSTADAVALDRCPEVPDPVQSARFDPDDDGIESPSTYGTSCTNDFVIERTNTWGRDFTVRAHAVAVGACGSSSQLSINAYGDTTVSGVSTVTPIGRKQGAGTTQRTYLKVGVYLYSCVFDLSLPTQYASPYGSVRVAARARVNGTSLPVRIFVQ